jgi:hypothetical protein
MKRQPIDRITNVCILVITLLIAASSAAVGLEKQVEAHRILPEPAATPSYSGYKGVKIGMPADDARKLLGTPKEKGDSQDYYVYSENETAQVIYDTAHTVTTISVTYIGKASSIPVPKDVFGEDAAPKPDGSITKMVRYPKNGYWISYNRTAGDDPIVMVTAQKMNGSPEN